MIYRFLRFPGGKTKAVTFSYDDGRTADMHLAEIFARFGMKGTFNICSSLIGQSIEGRDYMSAEEIQEHILDKGHEVATHGAYHKGLGAQRAIEGIRDVLECRTVLEDTFGTIIRGLAYSDSGIKRFANGATYENVRRYLTDLDIAYARTSGQDNNGFDLPIDWYKWIPSAKHMNPNIMDYIEEFNSLEPDNVYAPRSYPRLFYIWGHSFEFDRDNNWELIEEICEKLSSKEDTWYATNMGIYEYVKAYEALVYSADGKTVYNPTLFDVWFRYEEATYCVKSGETIKTN